MSLLRFKSYLLTLMLVCVHGFGLCHTPTGDSTAGIEIGFVTEPATDTHHQDTREVASSCDGHGLADAKSWPLATNTFAFSPVIVQVRPAFTLPDTDLADDPWRTRYASRSLPLLI